MRVLLTGADGFTGRPFAALAQRLGHEVVPLKSDLTNAQAVHEEVLQIKPDAVVHLAGIAFVGHAHEEAFYAVNVVGTTNLLDGLVQLDVPPRATLLASSANVYGNSDRSPIVEAQVAAPVNHYAMSKLAMELMARTYMSQLNILIVRPFNYTGPRQDEAFLIPKLAKHFAQRSPSVALGNLHVEREFNDVRMVCQAYLDLLEIGEPGEVYNVCSGRPYQLREVIDTFEALTGHTMEVTVNPSFVRSNEVHRLCGSPDKLHNVLATHQRQLRIPELRETLETVLMSAEAATSAPPLG